MGRNDEKYDWKPYLHLLGTASDSDVAQIIGCHGSSVGRKRRRLGISSYHPTPQPRSRIYRENEAAVRAIGQENIEKYFDMVSDQDGRCKICGQANTTGKSRSLLMDHCHKTGYVRGLLCNKCNRGLGLFNDNPKALRAAAEYVDSFVAGNFPCGHKLQYMRKQGR